MGLLTDAGSLEFPELTRRTSFILRVGSVLGGTRDAVYRDSGASRITGNRQRVTRGDEMNHGHYCSTSFTSSYRFWNLFLFVF